MQPKLETRDLILKLIVNLIELNFAFIAAYYLSFSDFFYIRGVSPEASYQLLLITANLLSIIITILPSRRAEKTLRNYGLFLISYLGIIVLLQGYEFSRTFHLHFLTLLFALKIFLKFSNVAQLFEKFLLSDYFEKKTVLVGDDIDSAFIRQIKSRPGNYKLIGFISNTTSQKRKSDKLYLGKINSLEQILEKKTIDEVLISTSLLPVEKVDNIIKISEKYHATTSILPPYFQFLSKNRCHTDYWMGVPVVSVFHTKLAVRSNQILKRAIDVCLSLFFLLAIFPILCLIVIPAIWLSDKGPVFFKQLRKGYKQKPFLCYKFRTMKLDTGIKEVVQVQRQDSRVTSIGKSLRKTSLDEMPQFLNVLFGNMSLVGPRPHMIEHDESYDKIIARYNVRFVAKPGITGWAQVNGYRGSTENPEMMQKRIEHDLWYIKNWSLWLDIKIIWRTALKLLFEGDQNAY